MKGSNEFCWMSRFKKCDQIIGRKITSTCNAEIKNQNNYFLKCLDGVIMHKNLNDSHLFLCGIGIADEHNLADKIS